MSSVEAGMGTERQFVHRTMHILDVISSVSGLQNALISLAAGASPKTPLGKFTTLPDSQAEYKRGYF